MKTALFSSGWQRLRIVCVLLAALSTAGACTEEPTEGPDAGSGRPIEFGVCQTDAMPWAAASRAADDGAEGDAEGAGAATSAGSAGGVFPRESEDSDLTLYLHATVSDIEERESGSAPATRSIPLNEYYSGSDFGVITFVYNATDEWSENFTPSLMVNTQVKWESRTWDPTTHTQLPERGWVTQENGKEQLYYWPGVSKKIRFFAYAPYDMSEQVSNITGTPTISFTVSEDVRYQSSFLIATPVELPGNGSKPIDLEFHHAMTAIRFVVGSKITQGFIHSISLKGVFGKGVCAMDGETWWSDLSRPNSSYTVTFDPAVRVVATSTGMEITKDDQIFHVIPQTLPADAKIEMEFTKDGDTEAQTLTASIAGTEWQRGRKVTYKISVQSNPN